MASSWAGHRQRIIIGIVAAVLVLLGSGIAFAIIYDAPSCTDRKQNQDETGIDCGGSCAYLCSAAVSPARISFARAIPVSGRTDFLAYVENRNQAAEAKDAKYTAELFAEDGTLLAKREGMADIPARSLVPVFIPNLYAGEVSAARAFLSFDADVRWRTPLEVPALVLVGSAALVPGNQPRVNATVENASARPVYGQKLVATVFDAAGMALAASQTVVREIPGQGEAAAVFTWAAPFPGTPARVEVLPVVALP